MKKTNAIFEIIKGIVIVQCLVPIGIKLDSGSHYETFGTLFNFWFMGNVFLVLSCVIYAVHKFFERLTHRTDTEVLNQLRRYHAESIPRELRIVVETTGTGYSGYAEEIAGLASVGDTREELHDNLLEVLQYQLDYLSEEFGINIKRSEFKFNYENTNVSNATA